MGLTVDACDTVLVHLFLFFKISEKLLDFFALGLVFGLPILALGFQLTYFWRIL